MSDSVWIVAVGERSPQQTPKLPFVVSFFAAAWNCAHVHGLATVGALMPALRRIDMFAKTLYVWSMIGTPVILWPKFVVSHTLFGISFFRSLGINGVRFAR